MKYDFAKQREQHIGNDEKKVEDHWSKVGIEHLVQVEADYELSKNDTRHLKEHNELFTKLLRTYVEVFSKNYGERQRARRCFFIVSIIILVSVTLLFFSVVAATFVFIILEKDSLVVGITSLLTSISAVISAYIVMPRIIVDYLFNKDEENNLSEIIGKIQSYDEKIRDKRQ